MKVWVVVGVCAWLLAMPTGAMAAGSFAKVVNSDGRVLGVGTGDAFRYPSDGSLVQIGSATTTAGGESLTNVQLLGGMVQVGEIDVFPHGRIAFGTIAAAGRIVTPVPNEIVQLGPAGYIILEQEARANGQVGRVAIRLVLQQNANDTPAGTEILIGTPLAPNLPGNGAQRAGVSFDPFAVLGLSPATIGETGWAPTSSGSIGMRAVGIAEQFLGVPYVWGGASPIPGFDCSGLAMYVYAQLGIKLTHYTGAQYYEGLPIPINMLAPGDLVFFDENATLGPQHEGIYIGDGQFIQAPHTGDVVKISNLSDYGLAYVGAVRPYDRRS